MNSSNVCFPIEDVQSLLKWTCDNNCWIHKHDVNVLHKRTDYSNIGNVLDVREKNLICPEYKLPQSTVPRTVICHDFKGGYLEDKYCNGSPNTETYLFYNWSVVDIFIYFSHKFVTIPPHGWIDVAHKHGVPVLGTLITEWTDGENIWNDILTDANKINNFSQKLAEICAHFKFDGYLLNIENKIPKGLIPQLIKFVALLKSHLSIYCKRQTWLLWYDSVTIEGTLDWQNKLCPLNKPFFDQCDGIFLNYVWTPSGLIESLKEAGDRKLDVYVGVDVWGRNCYYDGGFNVDKALAVLRSLNMSAAIFAPGWTFEAAPLQEFPQRELMFWDKISRYMYIHGPVTLPFFTNFCQGITYHDTPKFLLSAQQYQPTYHECISSKSCISPRLTDRFVDKQICLEIKSEGQEHSKMFHRVFVCDFSGNGKGLNIELSLRNSLIQPATKFQVYFLVEDRLSIEGKQSVKMTSSPKGQRSLVKAGGLNVVGSVIDFTQREECNEIKIVGKTCSADLDKVIFTLNMPAESALTEILVLPPPAGIVQWGSIKIDVAS